jgi:hypothetical protein
MLSHPLSNASTAPHLGTAPEQLAGCPAPADRQLCAQATVEEHHRQPRHTTLPCLLVTFTPTCPRAPPAACIHERHCHSYHIQPSLLLTTPVVAALLYPAALCPAAAAAAAAVAVEFDQQAASQWLVCPWGACAEADLWVSCCCRLQEGLHPRLQQGQLMSLQRHKHMCVRLLM